ncbi:MAG: transposase [Sedimentisphaerales bacterium]|nr:transposase [Sedimentisphaerales bacterium]
MARIARTVVAGCAHHLTQWGNNREDVFFDDDDRRVYLEMLSEQADRYGLVIEGYCLMSNHVHLVAVPQTEEALALAVGRTHFRYTQHIHRLHERTGHLWQGRFYSCALDPRHFRMALKYVELNPVRARLCRKPWRYEWSSAAAHVGAPTGSQVLDLAAWHRRMSDERWRQELSEPLPPAIMNTLRLRTCTGRPLGSDAFVSKLETLLGRRLRPLPVGRPRKMPTSDERRGKRMKK